MSAPSGSQDNSSWGQEPGGASNASIALTTTTVYITEIALLITALPELGTALPHLVLIFFYNLQQNFQQNLHLHTQYSNLQSTFSKQLFEFL